MHARILLPLLALSLFGCGSAESVLTGQVTLDNQPLARGFVTLLPANGTQRTHGASVTDGKFSLKNVPPGEWKVLVSQTPEAILVKDETGQPTLQFPRPSTVTQDTKGNQSIVQVRTGKQNVQLALYQNKESLEQ